MALSDSLFLIEIIVEELKSYIDCKEFYINSQFANVFTLNLRDPNQLEVVYQKPSKKRKSKKKTKVRNAKATDLKSSEAKVQTGQSILFANNIELLLSNMKQYPIELSLWDKDHPDYRKGSTHIPWSTTFIDYLNKLSRNIELPPAVYISEYNVFDEFNSKRMATIKLNIKLTYLKDKITNQFRSLSEENQDTFMYTGYNSKPSTILSTIKEAPLNLEEDTGIIKTIYSAGKRNRKKSNHNKKNIKEHTMSGDVTSIKEIQPIVEATKTVDKIANSGKVNASIVSLVRSDTSIDKKIEQIDVIQTKSCSSINKLHFNTLNYIFGGNNGGPYGNQIYCVGYFTVEPDNPLDSSKSSLKAPQSSEKIEEPKAKYKFRICNSDCPSRKEVEGSCSQSFCSLDLPEEATHLISITKCKQVECDDKKHKEVSSLPDDRILLDLTNLKKDCCGVTGTLEEVVGGMEAKMTFGEDPCYCSCECRFGFTKRTTYCTVCGGYENVGEELASKPKHDMPFPCPIFHKIVEKGKLKSMSTSGSDSRKKVPVRSTADKSAESDKDTKKGKKKKKDDRFKFNYGYQAPQIGHSQCTFPCTGTLGAVPKNMGWLWTAEDVPGMKFRPMWKPGATNKHVVRLLKMAKNPGEMAKKRRKDAGKKKRPLKRPLLIVQKKDGEYTVTMETMKVYPKPRAINQQPFEDKPLLTYTIGRTDEENRDRQMKKERDHRRLERAQRQFIQSAFKDMCKEICLKTYQQALGILPDTEDPDCPCLPAHPDGDKLNLDLSCSCSEIKSFSGSDTDSDEWIVEFTPPNATFDPTFKCKKVFKVDNATQYTYLDYRVKLLDRYGNPVPRFFKGPDGKQQCSDLGGFWSPNHVWLEINVDGYIAADGRWAPLSFIGPNGEQVETDTGKFQATNGRWLVVGVDGYIDPQGKWKFYPKPRGVPPQKKRGAGSGKKGAGDKKDNKLAYEPSETTWSCFGDVTPRQLSKMGIVGHGQDKQLLLSTLKDMLAHGEDVKIPQPSTVPRLQLSKKGKGGKRRIAGPEVYDSHTYFEERVKCRHPVPSDKGIAVDAWGNKKYFKIKKYKNKRPKERLANLGRQGISLSSFHEPCFRSFISTELMKQEQYERIMALNANSAQSKCVSTQIAR